MRFVAPGVTSALRLAELKLAVAAFGSCHRWSADPRSPYGRSKLAPERRAIRANAQSLFVAGEGLRVVLNPSHITSRRKRFVSSSHAALNHRSVRRSRGGSLAIAASASAAQIPWGTAGVANSTSVRTALCDHDNGLISAQNLIVLNERHPGGRQPASDRRRIHHGLHIGLQSDHRHRGGDRHRHQHGRQREPASSSGCAFSGFLTADRCRRRTPTFGGSPTASRRRPR